MKYINHITDHAEKANSYLLQQYKDKPNIKALLDSIIEPMQEIEDKAYEFYIQYYLPVAISYHLDRLGAIIGVNRQGRSDDKYRYFINLGIISNNSGATANEIITILKSIYIADKIEYLESSRAYFQIYVQGTEKPENINKLLFKLKPAGVNVPSVIYSDNSNVFRFAEKVTELVPSIVRSNNSKEEYNLVVQNNNSNISELDIMYDSFQPLENTLGFGEIIVNKPNLSLFDGSNYIVDNIDELQMLLAYSDYTIEAGSSFAEYLTS